MTFTRTDPDLMMNTYKRWPIEFVSGRGATLIDAEGRAHIDLLAGIAVASVGHSHPVVAAAIADQAQRLMHVSNLFATGPQQILAARLAELTGGYRSFFCNSGAEAIEAAIKLVRKWAGTHRPHAGVIVAAEGGFHGRTMGALAATGQPTKQAPFAPMLGGFVHVPYGDADALDAAVTEDVAAVLLEPIQGEAGVIVPPEGYIAVARAICDRAGALLVLDEIQTGVGRTGDWFAYCSTGVRPDIVCLAKGLAAGLPIGVCLARDEVASAFEPGDHATTFGGGPVVCAAALATIEVIEAEGLLDNAAARGEQLKTGLESVFGPDVTVGGRGLLLGAKLTEPWAHDFVGGALEAGVILNDIGAHVVRATPPLVVTSDEIDSALSLMKEVWDELRPS